MLVFVLTTAFLATALLITALVLIPIFRKKKKRIYVSIHRLIAILAVIVAFIHGFFAYDYFVYQFLFR
jgi:hypothetical protein